MEQKIEEWNEQNIEALAKRASKWLEPIHLATLRDDQGEKKITDATAISTILDLVQELCEDIKPLWV